MKSNHRATTLQLICAAALCLAAGAAAADRVVWVDDLPLDGMDVGSLPVPKARESYQSTPEEPAPLRIGARTFSRGVGSHAPSASVYEFPNGGAKSFEAVVGVDAWVAEHAALWKMHDDAKVRFRVVADDKVVAESPEMVSATPAFALKADLTGAKLVRLEIDELGSQSWDISVWGDARFTLEDGAAVEAWSGLEGQLGILTPPPGEAPRINGARVFGVRPGHPILWRLPVTGARPMKLSAANLPAGAAFDAATGLLSGSVAEPGEYRISFTAENAAGKAASTLRLVVGDRLALTPPMGWNSWNVFGSFVTDADMRAAADAMIATGLADHGWSYVNLDDYWQNSVDSTDEPTLKGPLRAADGTVVPNVKFPDMKALADYIHSKGLLAGLYSSPAAKTCGGCEGSWGHEWKDAETYAKWGYDYLKYDGCSYAKHLVGEGTTGHVMPFLVMAEALKAQDRDIVFSINPYGAGSHTPLLAGAAAIAGANSWRTTDDINDSWYKVRRMVDGQRHRWLFARPGAWNDSDMLVVGVIGGPWKFRRPTRLTQNMQYTHISLWCMLCSPLLIGCDLTKLDDFTLSLLTNDEVLETNQDELGAQAEVVASGPRAEIWAKPMSDGSFALALVNTVRKATTVTADFASLGLEGKWRVRDLWRQRELGTFAAEYSCDVPPLATQLVRLYPVDGAGLRKGLTDIRMNGFYRVLETSRPVGRPGYEPPKSWPCRECPRQR